MARPIADQCFFRRTRRPRSTCEYMQANLGLYFPHNYAPKTVFSSGAQHFSFLRSNSWPPYVRNRWNGGKSLLECKPCPKISKTNQRAVLHLSLWDASSSKKKRAIANNKGADQPAQTRMMICAFVARTYIKASFSATLAIDQARYTTFVWTALQWRTNIHTLEHWVYFCARINTKLNSSQSHFL